jgi:MFS family permease
MAFMEGVGFQPTYAAAIVSGYMAVLSVAKLCYGTIFDKFGPLIGAFISGFVNFLAPLALVFIGMTGMPILFAFAFGFAYATQTVPPALFTAAIFGNKDYTSVYGLVLMFITVGSAVGAPICGVIYDLTGSYHAAWLLLAASGAISTVFYVTAVRLGIKRTEDR